MKMRDFEIKLDALSYQGFDVGDECFDHYLKLWEEAKDTIREFKREGIAASVNYADDTTAEWKYGDKHKAKAMKLFNENPDLQEEMTKIAKRFLWTLPAKHPPTLSTAFDESEEMVFDALADEEFNY